MLWPARAHGCSGEVFCCSQKPVSRSRTCRSCESLGTLPSGLRLPCRSRSPRQVRRVRSRRSPRNAVGAWPRAHQQKRTAAHPEHIHFVADAHGREIVCWRRKRSEGSLQAGGQAHEVRPDAWVESAGAIQALGPAARPRPHLQRPFQHRLTAGHQKFAMDALCENCSDVQLAPN
jgi:hypothetical protein